ncbi:abortive infection system antitoxin AbiGi family protein [Kribbella sp. NPDC004875]|uniref:abortive infection system antitoxin AbiGi family protein n=1 Tax=Kribbella sp. NPDC004875 TaxID=3364107 RepID=UPI0036ABF0C9
MPDRIEQLLHRRTDLGTFLVHLTKDTAQSALENLLSIAESKMIEARTALGMAADLDRHLRATPATQRVACFSETPLEHTWMMARDIQGRKQSFQRYGVVFTKPFCRRRGCNPVWYLDITRGHDWLTEPIREQVCRAVGESTDSNGTIDRKALAEQSVLRITPFIEQMGKPNGTRKEFWWEREWRHVGDFNFRSPKHVVALLAPEEDHVDLAEQVANLSYSWRTREVPILDPGWGLERMISALAGVDPDDAGPWPD